MNMGAYEFRSKVENYTKEAIKDLEEVKKINDVEEQCKKISFDVRKHKQKLEELKQGKPEEISYYENYLSFNLDKYDKKVKELDVYWGEVAGKSNKIKDQNQKEQWNKEYELKTSHCAYCESKPHNNHYIYSKKTKELKSSTKNASPDKSWLFCSNEHFEKWHKKNYFCCAECLEEKWDGKYKYRKSKKDNKKFCSDECCNNHYAEICDKCGQKSLRDTYYNDSENKTGTLCSKCNNEYTCEECGTTKEGRYWYHTIKNDNKKFCSKQCFNDHYSETCVDCRKKVYSPYHDKKYPELTYCYDCYREAEKQGKELEKSSEDLGKAMNDLVDGMVEAVKRDKEYEEDLNVNDGDNNSDERDSSISNNSTIVIERERERERANSIKYEPTTIWNHSIRI